MRFFEGCAIVRIESWVPTRFNDYVRKLFAIARGYPTYIALSSYTVVTRIAGVARKLAIAPGSAILCDHDAYTQFNDYIELSESVWIDAALLVPYATLRPCAKVSKLSIDIGVEPEFGVPTHCLESTEAEELSKALTDIVQGGFVDIENYDTEVEECILVALKYNTFFLIWKAIGIGTPRVRVGVAKLPHELSPRVKVFLEPLARVGSHDTVIGIGRGYLSLFTPLDSNSETLYLTTLLLSYTIPPSSPRASLYLSRLSRY